MVLTCWRCFRGVKFSDFASCGHPFSAVSPTSSEMSSTLFNRGMNTQVGMRRRAEEVKKSIDELRGTITDARSMQATVDELSRENATLRALVTAMESRMSILEANAATQTITVAGLQAKISSAAAATIDTVLTSRVDAIESNLSTVAATTTQLQDRTGSVEANTATVIDRINSVDSNLQGRINGVESSTAAVSDRINAVDSDLQSRIGRLETRTATLPLPF